MVAVIPVVIAATRVTILLLKPINKNRRIIYNTGNRNFNDHNEVADSQNDHSNSYNYMPSQTITGVTITIATQAIH